MNSAINKANLEANQLKLSSGVGRNPIKGAIQDYASQFTTLANGIQTAFKPVFSTLSNGFADSLGRAIVYGKNLGTALKDVALSALSELISGLAKLRIQQVIQVAEGTASSAAAGAASIATAQAVGAA